MTAYVFFNVKEITDPDRLGEYRSKVFATVEAFEGRYLVLGGTAESVEGDWTPNIPVIIQFPSLEKAKRWYDSELYASLKELRLASSVSDAVFMEGFDHPEKG